MNEMTKMIKGDLILEQNTVLKGMIVGNVTVKSDVEFIVHGQITGNVFIRENSNVIVNGQINGDVINDGGYLEIYGMVKRLFRERGKTFIDENAVIGEL